MAGPVTRTMARALARVRQGGSFVGAEWPALRRATEFGLVNVGSRQGPQGAYVVRSLTLAGELVLAAWQAGQREAIARAAEREHRRIGTHSPGPRALRRLLSGD